MAYTIGLVSYLGSPHALTRSEHQADGVLIIPAIVFVSDNLTRYFTEACRGDERFAFEKVNPSSYSRIKNGMLKTSYGLAGLYGKRAKDTVDMLEDIKAKIKRKYMKNGEWITTQINVTYYFNAETEEELEWEDIEEQGLEEDEYFSEEGIMQRYEGYSENKWVSSAFNACRVIDELLELCKDHPEGVWDGTYN